MAADQGDVRVVMTANANKVLAEWQKMLRAAQQFNAALIKMTDGSKAAEQSLKDIGGTGERALESVARQVVGLVTRLGSVALAMRTIRDTFLDLQQQEEKHFDLQKSIAAFDTQLVLSAENEPGGLNVQAIRQRVKNFFGETGRNPAVAYQAFAQALSSKGILQQERAMSAVEATGKMFPNLGDEDFIALSSSIMDIMRADPKSSAKGIMGGLLDAALKSKAKDTTQFAISGGPAISALMNDYGMDFKAASSMVSSMSLTLGDSKMRRTATAALALAEQLRNATKSQLGFDASLTERFEWLQQPKQERLRKRLMAEFAESMANTSDDITGERRSMPAIRGMIDPGSLTWAQYQDFIRKSPGTGAAGERFAERKAAEVMNDRIQQDVADARAREGSNTIRTIEDHEASVGQAIADFRASLETGKVPLPARAYRMFEVHSARALDRLFGYHGANSNLYDYFAEEAQGTRAYLSQQGLSQADREDASKFLDLLVKILATLERQTPQPPPRPARPGAPPARAVPPQGGN